MNKDRLLDLFSKIQKDERPSNFHLNSRVLLVDGLNTFLRGFAGVGRMNLLGHEVGGIVGFLSSLGHAIKLLNPTRVVVVFDGESGSQNRKYLYPDYKANRDNSRIVNKKSFLTKGDEDDSKYNQIVRLVDYLLYLPILNISMDRLEADDVIGFLTSTIQEQYDDSEVFIMSSDNDFMQLVNSRVKLYSPTKKIIYHVDDILREFGVHPNNFLIYKALVGDSSDNIPGVYGLGDKKAPSLFKFLEESDKKNLEYVYEVCRNADKKSVLYDRVLNVSNEVEVFYKIMDLENPNISEEDKNSIVFKYHSKIQQFKKYDFMKLYSHDKMGDAIRNLDTWLNLFSSLNNYQ
jgi:DNA polymerase-1